MDKGEKENRIAELIKCSRISREEAEIAIAVEAGEPLGKVIELKQELSSTDGGD